MCKKLGISSVTLLVGLVLLWYTGLTSYVSTFWTQAKDGLKHQVPIEFEIERLRGEVAKIMPEMKKNFSTIAEEMVAVENLQKDVSQLRANLEKQKQNLLTMTNDLEKGTKVIYYDNKPYPADRVRDKLERDYASYKVGESELKSKEQLLEAREKSLEAAKEQMGALKSQKQDLEVQLAQLEADLKNVRLAQTRSKTALDDSQLARCKASLSELRDRLNVEVKKTELQAQFSNDAIPVDKKNKSTNDLIKDIKADLQPANGKATTQTAGAVVGD